MDRPAFQKLALEHLRKNRPGDVFVSDEDNFQIVARRADDMEHIVGLANYHAEYEHAEPAARAKVLDRLLAGLDIIDSGESLDELRPLLVPRIRPRRYYAFDTPRTAAQLGSGKAAPRIPSHVVLAEHLGVGVAIDRPERIEYIYDTSRFGVPDEELHAIALANMKRMSKADGWKELKPGLYVGHWNDDYAVERMLVPEVFASLTVKGDPVVFAPGAEVSFVAGADDDPMLRLAFGLATERMKEPRGLIDYAFVLRGGKWELFEPPTELGAELGSRLAMHIADVYALQREELAAKHEDDPDAPFVANVMGIGSEDGGLVATLASWAKDVRTWLPRTVLLGMGAPEDGELVMVTWADAVELAGDCLRKVEGLYPPRWETVRFPDDATFAKLKERALDPSGPRRPARSPPRRRRAAAVRCPRRCRPSRSPRPRSSATSSSRPWSPRSSRTC